MFAPGIVKADSAPPLRSAAAAQRPRQTAASGQLLQRTSGNQVMPRLRGRAERSQRPSLVPARLSDPAQANLHVGAIDDPLELQADHVADQIMRTQDSHVDSAGSQGVQGSKAPAVVNEALRSPGQPLDSETRNLLEPPFGAGFADVRVHRGPIAEQSARAIGARAYTVGRDIVLGAGACAPSTPDGRRLLAHELAHVVQQARIGPFVQRQPDRPRRDIRPDTKRLKAPADSRPKLSPFVQADSVRELKRDNETWKMTIDGFSNPDAVGRIIWPSRVPADVRITLEVAILDPVERGWFELSGITFDTLKTMEPSFAKLFSDHGLEGESKESAAVQDARAAFRARHEGHGDQILNTIDLALKKITKRNPDLLIAYYTYYADHQLTDESHWYDHFDYKAWRDGGATAYGDTIINPSVLRLISRFPSDDPTSLLAGTLIHEYVHTPQGGAENAAAGLPKEAKAYGIELFFSERMGDRKRAAVITKNMSSNDPLSNFTNVGIDFNMSYRIMRALYEVIDQGGPAAKEAREMSVEFISKNANDFGEKLKAFIAATRL
jgi:hypothetical protein